MPPTPVTPTVSPKYTLSAIDYPLPPPARTNVILMWNYAMPLPDPEIVFEVWSTQSLTQPFTLKAVVKQPPVSFPIADPGEFFICRASNLVSKLVSGWNTK